MIKGTSRTSLMLFLIRIIQMAVNVITVSLTAKFFGVSMERDMWVFTSTLVITLTTMFWGPINEVFRAKFIFIKEDEGEPTALLRTQSLFSFVIVITLIIGCLMALFSHHITDILVHNAETGDVFWKLFLLLIPTLIIRELTMLCTSLLNAYGVFYIPEYANLASGIVNIGLLVVLAPVMGIYSLVVSCYFSLTILLITIIKFIRRRNIKIISKGHLWNFRLIMPFVTFALPLYFPYFIGQLNEIVQNALANSLGAGIISTIGYSKHFPLIVQGIMSSVIATVMMPVLAQAYKRNDRKEYQRLLNENILLYLTIYGIFACATIGAASPVCTLLFHYGKMSEADVSYIILMTRYFSAAFFGVVLYLIFSISLLTTGRNKTYALIGTFTQVMVLLVNVALIDSVGIFVFPLSYGLAHLLTGLYMLYVLKTDHKISIVVRIARCAISIAFASASIYLVNEQISSSPLELIIVYNILLGLLVVPCMMLMMGLKVGTVTSIIKRGRSLPHS